MSGWRSALVAFVVGLAVLAAGYVLTNRESGPESTTTGRPDADRGLTLACVDSLAQACASVGESLGVEVVRWAPGSELPERTAVIAPAGDLPIEGTPLARSPIVIGIWRDRAEILRARCGTIDVECLSEAIGVTWEQLGGNRSWGDVKIGLADPTLSEPGLLAWSVVYGAADRSAIERSLRLEADTPGNLTRDMVAFGSARADMVVTTEIAVAGQMQNAIGRGGRLEVGYPASSPWVEFRVADGGGADDLVRRLLTAEVRQSLVAAGLRPVQGEESGLPADLGTPGSPGPVPDDAGRATLVAAWQDITG